MEILRFEKESNNSNRKNSSRGWLAVAFFAVVLGVGSAFASSTININENKGIDIGQGVSLVTTCDDQIVVSAKSSIDTNAWDTNTASSKPYFKLSGLVISGLDVTSNGCGNKILDIQVYNSAKNVYGCSDFGLSGSYKDASPTAYKFNCADSKISLEIPTGRESTSESISLAFTGTENTGDISAITVVSRNA